MDVKPFRPRGSENAISSLHQRHKSTGNLAAMANAPTAGFRGPAKRAAFGDVTNVAKNSGGGYIEGKLVKMQSSAALIPSPGPALLNKENVPFNKKETFLWPAQKLSNYSIKPLTEIGDRSATTKNSIESVVEKSEPRSVLKEKVASNENTTGTLKTDHIESSRNLEAEQEAPSLRLRQHRSQSDLKPQKPALRKTQSRQLERLDDIPTDFEAIVTTSKLDSGPDKAHSPGGGYNAGVALAGTTSDCQYQSQVEANHSQIGNEIQTDLPQKLLSVIEEAPATVASYKDNTGPAMSEPEEYWDDEEYEDYDDQDRAYTTGHSFRSRDFTTGGATTVLAPRVTSRVQRELEEAKFEVDRTRSREDIEEEAWDVSMVAEYSEEIFEYMKELEDKMLPNPHYMDIQTEIQWSMRSVLMDWLVQVHSRFSLLPETLFLTVNYIDRFLSSKVVSIGKLQLVGATAILLASKYEEINCPSLQEIVYMVDRGYSMDEILKAERFMLSMLGFELGWPGPMSFLRRVSKADDYDLETRTLAKYFLELTIMDERFVASPPSFLAAGAHCLSRLILQKGDWTKAHVHYSGYTWSQLKSLVTMMIGCCEQPQLHHAAVYEKYRERRFKEASVIVQEALDSGFKLPHHSEPVRGYSSQALLFNNGSDYVRQKKHPVSIEA